MQNPGYGLGRLPSEDARDGRYPLRALLAPAPTLPLWRIWSAKPALDQGPYPHCVGYAARQWISSSPVPWAGGPDAVTIYREAQTRDEWEGEAYDGTSARGAMKFLAEVGIVTAYYWTRDAEEASIYALTEGTLLFGLPWYEGMFATDRLGTIRPTGRPVGGHELLCVGYSRVGGRFRLLNSWGRWGENGRCWLLGEDLERLIGEGADVVAAVQSPPPGRA
jgi:hypothetical protein